MTAVFKLADVNNRVSLGEFEICHIQILPTSLLCLRQRIVNKSIIFLEAPAY